jgi:gas vesicle protein
MGRFEMDEPYVVIEKRDGSVGSLLLGIALGAGIALLFAPQSGMQTRRALTKRAKRAKRAATDLADDVTGKVEDTFQQARDRVENSIDSARRAIELKRRQVTRAVEAGRVAAQQARDDLERRIAETKAAYEEGAEGAEDATGGASGVGTA